MTPQLRRMLAYVLLLSGAALAVLAAMDDSAALPLVGQPEIAALVLVIAGIALRGRPRRQGD